VTCFEDAEKADREKFGRWHRGMLERGVYLAPSAYEARPCPGQAPSGMAVHVFLAGSSLFPPASLARTHQPFQTGSTGAPHPHNTVLPQQLRPVPAAPLCRQGQGWCTLHVHTCSCVHISRCSLLEIVLFRERHAMEAGGVQAGFTSLAHTEEDVDRTIEAAKEVFAEL
jgi:hypothetical protein